MAAARRHVQALTECGLPPEALLRALLEQYDGRRQVPGNIQATISRSSVVKDLIANDGIGFTQPASASHTPRLSVSTTSTSSTGRVSYMSTATTASSVSSHSSLLPQIQVVPPRGQASTRAYWCLECDTVRYLCQWWLLPQRSCRDHGPCSSLVILGSLTRRNRNLRGSSIGRDMRMSSMNATRSIRARRLAVIASSGAVIHSTNVSIIPGEKLRLVWTLHAYRSFLNNITLYTVPLIRDQGADFATCRS